MITISIDEKARGAKQLIEHLRTLKYVKIKEKAEADEDKEYAELMAGSVDVDVFFDELDAKIKDHYAKNKNSKTSTAKDKRRK